MITPYLKKLETIAKAQHSLVVDLLKDGLSKAEIEQITATTNLSLHPNVYELFEWKSGFTDPKEMTIGESLLFPWGKLEPLDLLVRVYHLFVKDGDLPNQFFPVFASGGGEFYLINCDKDSEEYGYIYKYGIVAYGEKPVPAYPSFDKLLECVIEGFESGALTFLDGELEENGWQWMQIATKYEFPYEDETDTYSFEDEGEDLSAPSQHTIERTALPQELFTSYIDSIVFSIPEDRKFDDLIFPKIFQVQLPIGLKSCQIDEKNIVFLYPDEQCLMICLDVNGNQPPGEWIYDGHQQDNLLTTSYPSFKGDETPSNEQRVNQLFIKQLDIVGMANVKSENYEIFHRSIDTYQVR